MYWLTCMIYHVVGGYTSVGHTITRVVRVIALYTAGREGPSVWKGLAPPTRGGHIQLGLQCIYKKDG